MNITGQKLHKIHILRMKKQYAKQWLKYRQIKYYRREHKKQKKQKEQKQKLQTYYHSKNVRHMLKHIIIKNKQGNDQLVQFPLKKEEVIICTYMMKLTI